MLLAQASEAQRKVTQNMAKSKLVGMLFEAWKDFDRVIDNLESAQAVENFDGGSSFAWTLAHVTNQVDAWANVRFQRLAPHDLIGQQRFRFGGTGVADDWESIRGGVHEVRQTARSYLQDMTDEDLTLTIPYEGSQAQLRQTGLVLRYALLRACAHHYFHIGEIASKRDRIGHQVGDYPGSLEECI